MPETAAAAKFAAVNESPSAEWEVRPGGMVVQMPHAAAAASAAAAAVPPVPNIRVKVKHGAARHDIYISSQASFGTRLDSLPFPSSSSSSRSMSATFSTVWLRDGRRAEENAVGEDRAPSSRHEAYLQGPAAPVDGVPRRRRREGQVDGGAGRRPHGPRQAPARDAQGQHDGEGCQVRLRHCPRGRSPRLQSNPSIPSPISDPFHLTSALTQFIKQVSALEAIAKNGGRPVDNDVNTLTESLMNELVKLDAITGDGDAESERRLLVKKKSHLWLIFSCSFMVPVTSCSGFPKTDQASAEICGNARFDQTEEQEQLDAGDNRTIAQTRTSKRPSLSTSNAAKDRLAAITQPVSETSGAGGDDDELGNIRFPLDAVGLHHRRHLLRAARSSIEPQLGAILTSEPSLHCHRSKKDCST